jgi:hypothetical protein
MAYRREAVRRSPLTVRRSPFAVHYWEHLSNGAEKGDQKPRPEAQINGSGYLHLIP